MSRFLYGLTTGFWLWTVFFLYAAVCIHEHVRSMQCAEASLGFGVAGGIALGAALVLEHYEVRRT